MNATQLLNQPTLPTVAINKKIKKPNQ